MPRFFKLKVKEVNTNPAGSRSHIKTVVEWTRRVIHKPSSPPSQKALELLKASLSAPYPPVTSSSSSSTENAGKPLDFNLEVVESPPTSDQLQVILSYLPSPAANPSLVFLSAHPSNALSAAEQPTTVKGIAELAQKNPNAIKWPIVVDWLDGKASIGSVDGVKGILEHLRKKRDGEVE
ncbi:hypothetical protein JR316_0010475 [Psilocybe cubensis]|uniref:Uncharacterized protein n=1 Tax=Psilocybe cubensis TaxID=181762 RepID=A0ACB8GLZ9_PSICU|nr:hypothetical protein JR316_0010475 [Psilocybe cubensis]KAH9476563.1 hypothetical protein JR316_0010475 [Psilocybe cubensis]